MKARRYDFEVTSTNPGEVSRQANEFAASVSFPKKRSVSLFIGEDGLANGGQVGSENIVVSMYSNWNDKLYGWRQGTKPAANNPEQA